jgi:RNA polymerase primary sigma factor
MKTMSEHLMEQAIRYKPLPPDEQSALVQRAQAGDQDARELLVLTSLRLVVDNLKTFPQFMTRNFEELYQAGVVGLLKAIDRYDASYGTKFSTYAVRWIQQSIRMWIYDQNVIYVPRYLHDATISVYQVMAQQGCQDVPELAARTNLRPIVVAHALQYLDLHMLSIDIELETGLIAEIVPDEYDLEADVEQDERARFVLTESKRLLALLKPRERIVVELRYGLTGQPEMKVIDIAHHLGKSDTCIRETLNRALCKMRAAACTEEAIAS